MNKKRSSPKIGTAADVLLVFKMVLLGLIDISEVSIKDVEMAIDAVAYAMEYGTSIDMANLVAIKADADDGVVQIPKKEIHDKGFMDVTYPLHCEVPVAKEGETNNEQPYIEGEIDF